MDTEFVAHLTEQLSLIWSHFRHAFLIPLLFVAMIILVAYLRTSTPGSRWWRGLREFVLPARFLPARTVKMEVVTFPLFYILLVPLLNVLGVAVFGKFFSLSLSRLMGPAAFTITDPSLVIPLQFFSTLAFLHFGVWLNHYLHHKLTFLWELHKVHHSAEAMAFITTTRFHPLELLVTSLPLGILLPAVPIGFVLYFTGGDLHPVAVSALAMFGIGAEVISLLNHSHIAVSFGWFSRIISSPAMHQIHHSAEPRHRDKNFGFFSVYDWIFGTLYIPSKGERFRVGISEDELGERNPHLTFRGFYLRPLIRFGKGLLALTPVGPRHNTMKQSS